MFKGINWFHENSTFNIVYANLAESKVHSNYMVLHFPSFFWLPHKNNFQDMTAILHVVELELENLVTSWSIGMWLEMIITRRECLLLSRH